MATTAGEPVVGAPVACSVRAQIVLYNNSLAEVWRLLRGLIATTRSAKQVGAVRWLEVRLGDCSPTPVLSEADVDFIREHTDGINSVTYEFFNANIKSALGHNTLARHAETDFLLVENPDTYAAPTMLAELLSTMADPRVGIAEARQIPLEHPKAYDLRTGDTSWASTCAVLVRRTEAFEAVGGFDHLSFPLYCDDVDFSWRVRLAGLRVVHVPRAVVFHDKQIAANGHVAGSQVEVYEGTLARLMLGRKYGRPDIVDQTVEWIEGHGQDTQVDALAEFRRRADEGTVPAALPDADRAAQFEGGEYAVHRF